MVEASLFHGECRFANFQCLCILGRTGPSKFRFDRMPVFLDNLSWMPLNHRQAHRDLGTPDPSLNLVWLADCG